MREQAAKPVWSTRYSHTCRMNLSKVMEKYGSLQNLWEGSIRGEDRFTKNWHIKLAENYFQENSIYQIIFKMKNDTYRNTELLY